MPVVAGHYKKYRRFALEGMAAIVYCKVCDLLQCLADLVIVTL